MNILYVTKLVNSESNGVTVAVMQLLNTISSYANVFWLDLSNHDFEINEKVKKVTLNEYINNNYDIAIIEDPFNSLIFCKIAKYLYNKKIPYILVPHGCFHKVALKRKWLKKKIAVKTVFKRYLSRCYGVQYLTNNELKNSVCFNNHMIIPNGINISKYYKITNKIKKIVFIGRKDIQHKGIDLLIDAANMIKDKLEENQCKIYIYGPINSIKDEQFIENTILKNNLKSVIINGEPVFADRKKEVLYSADAYIQTSRHEGFPMSILEAFSYGLPVLVTEGTNVTDIVKEYNVGWVSENDPQNIADMIKKAINCSNVCKISENARELSLKYTWDNVSKMTIEMYEKIIKEFNK